VSPSGDRVAIPDAKGPAGERIYTRRGGFVRNLVGHAAPEAIWSPDEQRLLLQADDHLDLFDFKSGRIGRFAHGGPSGLRVLDWRATSR
jgi:hypothetical protein